MMQGLLRFINMLLFRCLRRHGGDIRQQVLQLLRENIDELVIQSYQGSTTIPNYQSYLKKVSKLQLPYKIGIVQRGEWNPELNFSADPNFKGYVVFLLRSAP